ncbi:hypothetical protein RV134_240032 [Roseovarius sp. EC-HK134]|nr:hypothetical protein RV134_240032 [Roseovarius sp. EC-HK134]VVT03617.1 hypothetical protein RV420_270130 [Roseovarius sp. EC-SD190]
MRIHCAPTNHSPINPVRNEGAPYLLNTPHSALTFSRILSCLPAGGSSYLSLSHHR